MSFTTRDDDDDFPNQYFARDLQLNLFIYLIFTLYNLEQIVFYNKTCSFRFRISIPLFFLRFNNGLDRIIKNSPLFCQPLEKS